MKEERDFVTLFKHAIHCLKTTQFEFVVVGGSILPYFGHVRSTQDIDIMILADNISTKKLQNLVNLFNEYKLSVTLDELLLGLKENIHITVFDMINFVFRIDLKKISSQLDRLTYNTKRIVKLHGIDVPICRAESLISVKSMLGFRSNSDLEDILSLIELVALDNNLLKKFLKITDSKNFLCTFLKNIETPNITSFIEELNCLDNFSL